MYGYDYGYDYNLVSMSESVSIWVAVSLALAILGGVVLYFTFLSKKNEDKFDGFLGWLYDFLTFKKLSLEVILKITYLIAAIFVTLSSFALISESFLGFLLYLVIGNVALRIVYEFSLMLILICRNTTEINKKLGKETKPKKEDKE